MQVINILATAYIICLTARCVFGRAMKFEKLIAKNHEESLSEPTTVSAPGSDATSTTISAPASGATSKAVSSRTYDRTGVSNYAPAFDANRTNLTRRHAVSLFFNETGTVKVPKKLFNAFSNMED